MGVAAPRTVIRTREARRKTPSAGGTDWHRGRARLLGHLGLLTALLGGGLVALLVLGPTYGYCEFGRSGASIEKSTATSSAGTCGYRSMLDVQGVPPIVWGAAGAYLLVALGALDEAGRLPGSRRRPHAGRWLMLAATAPMVVIGMLSFGLAALLPATMLAVVATATAFSAPRVAPGRER